MIVGKKRTLKASKEAKELSIQLVGDSRMNQLEERGNDTIQERSNSDFNVKCSKIKNINGSTNTILTRQINFISIVIDPLKDLK
jgi:hypothetical protein